MQFKLFTATVAAMAVGSAIAGPMPAVDANTNALAARAEQAVQNTNAALAQQQTESQAHVEAINAAQQKANLQVPDAATLSQIKLQVTTSQQRASSVGRTWWPYYYDPDCYDHELWTWYQPYFLYFATCWNTCYPWPSTCSGYYLW